MVCSRLKTPEPWLVPSPFRTISKVQKVFRPQPHDPAAYLSMSSANEKPVARQSTATTPVLGSSSGRHNISTQGSATINKTTPCLVCRSIDCANRERLLAEDIVSRRALVLYIAPYQVLHEPKAPLSLFAKESEIVKSTRKDLLELRLTSPHSEKVRAGQKSQILIRLGLDI
ncbi:hypothetical protein BR93DRAFT_389975 [Coniochaeta sp. PMI_546]|nr:hypothetical protein BR93DRAFT_389975 [Coniochaeta sp. PMI_546]